MGEKRKTYHTFKRKDEDGNVLELTCLVVPATALVTIEVIKAHILEALRRNGQADGQNCAGAVCVVKSAKRFNHPIGVLVDWFRNRLFIHTGARNKQPICVVYAHYDNIEALFDGDTVGLTRLLKRVEKKGFIPVNLFPIVRGFNPRTGKKTRPSGPRGVSGKRRPPRGNDARAINYLKARGLVPMPDLLPSQ